MYNWIVKYIPILFIIVLMLGGGCAKNSPSADLPLTKSNMEITSNAFLNNEEIPSKYTCDGEDASPPLKITDVPEDAKSLVLIVDDPDAPAGTWVHWTVWNIEPDFTEFPENEVPDHGIQGITSFGTSGYGGPCPPSGTHRYFFKIFALDTMLNLDMNTDSEDLKSAIEGHVIDKAELIGLYSKS